MKLIRFEKDGQTHFGSVEDDGVRVLEGSYVSDFKKTGLFFPLDQVRLLSPVSPSKVVCVAHNYRELVAQIEEEVSEEPLIFLKPPSCLIGPGQPIVIPAEAERVIFEGEMAVVIKKKMKNVPEELALEGVLGCACFNDVTERAMIERDRLSLTLGKGLDTFGPIGPWVVTDLEPNHLDIRTRLNGELKQQDNTSRCLFSVQRILSFISRRMTLFPGDVVTTGTPQGIDTLRPGDVVEVEIEGVGRLSNPVQAGPAR